jgi:hypothetical protein
MKKERVLYYLLSFSLSALSLAYCILVFLAGQRNGLRLGSFYLVGIPNYYFFYVVILPFFAAGVLYLGFENRYIRFVGALSEELSATHRSKIGRWRRILPFFCLLFSVLIVVQDGAQKSYTLPPYSFHFAGETQARAVAEFYACARGWTKCGESAGEPDAAQYLSVLQSNGIAGDRATGFDSIPHWWHDASRLYRFESFLSFLATLTVSFFVAEIFLLIIVKNYAKAATRNLIMWMLILISFWFPAENYSAWNYNVGEFEAPIAFVFGLVVLVLGALLVLFIRTERNDLAKYGSTVVAVFTFGLGAVSYIMPKFLHDALALISQVGVIYLSIAAAIVGFALYLITDYFIDSYEQEIGGPAA